MPKPTADAKNFFGDIDLRAATWRSSRAAPSWKPYGRPGCPQSLMLPPWRLLGSTRRCQHNGIIVRDRRRRALRRSSDMTARELRRRRASEAANAAVRVERHQGQSISARFVAGPVFVGGVRGSLVPTCVKVEPMTGDPNRSIFRSLRLGQPRQALRHRSIVKTPEGLKIAQQSAYVAADVVTSNFRPGVSASLGIDAQDVART